MNRKQTKFVSRSGMHRQQDRGLTQYDERGWRAPFYTTGMEPLAHERNGHRLKRPPWHAAQRAAWGALTKDTNKAFRKIELEV